MITISIDKNSKFKDIETYLTRLEEVKDFDVSVDVLLPKTLKYSYFGLVPSLIQFVVTWLRYKKAGKLLIDIEDLSNESLTELYKNELIFPLVILAWNKTGVYTKDGTSLRGYLNPINKLYMEKMLSGRTIPGNKLMLTDFDHLPEDKSLPCFGDKYQFVRTKTQLKNSLDKGLKEVFAMFPSIPYAFEKADDPFITIIYELMKNTFEWGRHDNEKVPLDPNIRGTFLKFIKKKRSALLDEYKWQHGLISFFSSPKLKENNLHELYLLEITVFDGGVGFLKKYKSSNKQAESLDEIDIIKKCLRKHSTSAVGIDRYEKGLGLDEILYTLDGRGFIRIKTGHSCVYRNLITDTYKDNEDLSLYDWQTNLENDYTTFKETEGSVITIVYPIAFSQAAI